MNAYREPGVLYRVALKRLELDLGAGVRVDVSDTLSNGRANYVLFQKLTGLTAGLDANSEGGDSDLVSETGEKYEVKAYKDPVAHPGTSAVTSKIHTAASSTFGANNRGPIIRDLLAAGNYAGALQVCVDTGYAKNDFYVYTNTRDYTNTVPFSYLILPTRTVLAHLSGDDPRLIMRDKLLSCITRTETVNPQALKPQQ